MGTVDTRTRIRRTNAAIAILVVVVAVLVVSVLARHHGSGSSGAPDSAARQPSTSVDSPARRNPGDPLALGSPEAPVVLVAYEDFRCPFCAKFATDSLPKLVDRYVEPGVLRVEWRDYPIFGEQSIRAAKAGRAAARQHRFWEFERTVYSHAPDHGHPDLPLRTLVRYAEQAGVADIERFRADMRSAEVATALRADRSEGVRLGVSSTPTFLVNGRPIMGAQPFEVFVSAVEQAAEQAGTR
ncbi:DsbA family protein [Actinopolyspora mortivallis]|uniref:Disulfide bond formation protein n=1 Tax=Actinopolyspora mortivallis TaxID=33906 RepID=A0A2T0GYL1_ACTMO|nr:thioredoxin domain-containing protein [Actinopolyspora mortivallis]PRW64199.1 disulfide bond formation protein [Actinopolyspora mortivallis]